MSNSLVLDFLAKAKQCKNISELCDVVGVLFKEAGFLCWGYQTQPEAVLDSSRAVTLHNFPDDWVQYYFENECHKVDPVLIYGSELTEPFRWSDIGNKFKLSDEQNAFMSKAADYGLSDGIAVPILGSIKRQSIFSMVTKDNALIPSILEEKRDELIAVAYAFHTMVKDFQRDEGLSINHPELTPREKECLFWTARGKSAKEVSAVLSITERTVVFHLNNAKKKFNVTNKYQLIIQAISGGYIEI